MIVHPFYDLFPYDLRKLPDERFVEVEKDVGALGQTWSLHRTELHKLQFSMFTSLEAECENGACNILRFSTANVPSIDLATIQRLTNQLFEIYGPDDRNMETFSQADAQSIATRNWAGRMWFDRNRHDPPLVLTMDEKKYYLVVFLRTR